MRDFLALYMLLAAVIATTYAIRCRLDPTSPDVEDEDSGPLCSNITDTIPHYARPGDYNNDEQKEQKDFDHEKCPPGTELDPPRQGVRYPSSIPICVKTRKQDLPPSDSKNKERSPKTDKDIKNTPDEEHGYKQPV